MTTEIIKSCVVFDCVIQWYSMKKENLEKQLKEVLEEALKLQSSSELQLATAAFLRGESKKLMAKMDDPMLPYDQKEEVGKQMIALQKRLECEVLILENDIPKMVALEKRMSELKAVKVED
jgi:hypothetical protein